MSESLGEMRSARIGTKKSVKDSVAKGFKISVKCITDSDVKKVITGEECTESQKRIFEGILKSGIKEPTKGENVSENGKKTIKQVSRQTRVFEVFDEEATKREIEKIVGVHRYKNVVTSIENTPSPVKRRGKQKKHVEYTNSDCSEEDDLNIMEPCEKPVGLCDDSDVAGNEMCSFRTPKKRQGMYQKALESAGKLANPETPKSKFRTPSRHGTPLSTSKLSRTLTPKKKVSTTKRTPVFGTQTNKFTPHKKAESKSITLNTQTPYNLRVRQKKDIQAHMRALRAVDDSEDSDYHGSDRSSSESDDSDSPSEKDDSSSDSGKGSEEPKPQCRRSLQFRQPLTSKRKCKDTDYVFTADEFFESQGGKCKTSDHRLSRLQTPRLDNSALHDLLSHCTVSHPHILADRRSDDIAMFERWMFALSQGFNILAYGLGSKYNILKNFHRKMLPDSRVLVVNGFFPSLSIKEVVEMIARDLLGLKQVLLSSHAVIDWIENRRHMPRIFLIVHNIDAEPLRSDKSQHILSRLASLSKVHLVASVDHINSPLLWDQAKLSGFNFMWEDTTSFLPFQEETSYETSLMVQNSGSLAVSSLLNVYRSLTHNSRGVFRIILEKHIEENSQKYIGMAFSSLYKKCRDEMLVTNDLTLRTMLTEFLDHQMVKWRRDSEHLYIPVETGVLQQFHKIIQES